MPRDRPATARKWAMAVFLVLVVAAFLAMLSVWSFVTGRRPSAKQTAPPDAVRCRSAGALLALGVLAVVVWSGPAEAVDRLGPFLGVVVVVSAGLWIAGEVIERSREAGTESARLPIVASSSVGDSDRDPIELSRPRSRSIDLRDGTAVRAERPERPRLDDSSALRLPRRD